MNPRVIVDGIRSQVLVGLPMVARQIVLIYERDEKTED